MTGAAEARVIVNDLRSLSSSASADVHASNGIAASARIRIRAAICPPRRH